MSTIKLILMICVVAIGGYFVTGCAQYKYIFTKEKTYQYAITNSTFENAYNKSIKSATEIGMSVFSSDKSSGTFYATRGTGFGEISELNALLTKENNKLILMLRVHSSNGDDLLEQFVRTCKKYVKLTQMHQ